MGRVPVQVFKNPRVRDEAIIQTGDLRHFGALCKRDSLPVGSRRERRCERHSGRARCRPCRRLGVSSGVYSARGPSPSGATPRRWRRRERRFASTSTCVPARDRLVARRASSRRVSRSPRPPCAPRQESAHLGPEEAKKKIAEGVEAESFIRLHVVQAVGNERGNYEMRVEPQHVDGEHEVPPATPRAGVPGPVRNDERRTIERAKDELHHRVASVPPTPSPRERRRVDDGEDHLRLVPDPCVAANPSPHPATA